MRYILDIILSFKNVFGILIKVGHWKGQCCPLALMIYLCSYFFILAYWSTKTHHTLQQTHTRTHTHAFFVFCPLNVYAFCLLCVMREHMELESLGTLPGSHIC